MLRENASETVALQTASHSPPILLMLDARRCEKIAIHPIIGSCTRNKTLHCNKIGHRMGVMNLVNGKCPQLRHMDDSKNVVLRLSIFFFIFIR